MAKFTDEERVQKTIKIANYIIDNNASTRRAALHFGISNATVSDWMNYTLKKIDNNKYLKVEAILKQNKPKTVEDVDVRRRVLSAATLIKEGYTVQEIANVMNVSVNIINEDLQTRLPRININAYMEIKRIQQKNSRDNLIVGKNMTVEEQKRDENGRFTR